MNKDLFKKIVVSVISALARRALKTHAPKIVAVTGNVGKTSTKDAIYTVLKDSFSVRKSEKSFNSEIGIPLTILGLDNAWSSPVGWLKNIAWGAQVAFGMGKRGAVFPQWLVLEVGADHPGDIESVSTWLHPDIVVLTRMSDVPVHVEFFSGPEAVLREKMFLARGMRAGGTLVVNADDTLFMRAVKDLDVRKVLYGESKSASSRIVESEVVYDASPLFLPRGQYVIIESSASTLGEQECVELAGLLGKHLVYPIAAAHAVAGIVGVTKPFAQAFAGFEAPKGRMRILEGKSQSVIIDDSYNSSPLASREAIMTLGALATRGRKIAVLGDMRELGGLSDKAHRGIGELCGHRVHTLVTVGPMGASYEAGARYGGLPADRIVSFATSIEAGAYLAGLVRAGDVILVKGSQSMRMERVSQALLANPSEAVDLLVRQEDEWKFR